jgi:hypothetical protein
MDSLIVKGPFVGPSGYAHLTREFVKNLVDQGVKVQLVELKGWGGASSDEARDSWFRSLSAPVESGVVQLSLTIQSDLHKLRIDG